MNREERDEQDRLLREFVDEFAANRTPTREQWQAMLDKWQGRVNVEVLLRYGDARGWLD